MTIGDNLKTAISKLNTSPTPRLDAEVLLSSIFKKNKEYLYTYPEKELTKLQAKKFKSSIEKRNQGQPIAYILGLKEFYGLIFKVNKHVLIPRPETEDLVDLIIKQVNDLKHKTNIKNPTILDIGTGSGCIAISLKKQLPQIKIIASDKYNPAIRVAKDNAKTNKVKIKFIQSDLLTKLKKSNFKIDILVANLPYLKKDEQHISIKFEPNSALYGDLTLFKKLFQQIKELKTPPQAVTLEINTKLAEQTLKLAKKYFNRCYLMKDLSKKNRFLVIEI